jgi:uncharacterized protein
MFFNVAELQLGKVRFQEIFAPGAIEFFDPQLKQDAPVESSGVAEMSEATGEIRVSGHVKTRMELACDRCLEQATIPLEADFSLLYRPASTIAGTHHEEVLLNREESEVGFYEGEGLELRDVVREEILLLMPMQRVCSEDCKGICPMCGQNRNQVACECHEKPADDRWAGLKNL